MKIFINNSVLHSELSNEAIAAFIAIKSLVRSDLREYYVTPDLLCYIISGDLNMKRAYKEKVKNGLDELVSNQILKVLMQREKALALDLSEYIIDYSVNSKPKALFTIVTTDELHKIFNIDTRTDKFLLIRYFASMISTFNSSLGATTKRRYIGYMPIQYIAKLARTNQQTGCRYNKLLVDNGLIYIHKGLSSYDYSGVCHASSNHYGRACDAALIENYLAEQIATKSRTKSENDLPF